MNRLAPEDDMFEAIAVEQDRHIGERVAVDARIENRHVTDIGRQKGARFRAFGLKAEIGPDRSSENALALVKLLRMIETSKEMREKSSLRASLSVITANALDGQGHPSPPAPSPSDKAAVAIPSQ